MKQHRKVLCVLVVHMATADKYRLLALLLWVSDYLESSRNSGTACREARLREHATIPIRRQQPLLSRQDCTTMLKSR